MLQDLDLNAKIEKDDYRTLSEMMGLRLSALQRDLRTGKIPCIILFHGWEAAGKGTILNRLLLNLDPRGFSVHTPTIASNEELHRPFLWPHWIRTPAVGQISLIEKGWYEGLESSDSKNLRAIINFEKMLTDSGCIILKFFLHISKKEQEKRFLKLESSTETAWRINKQDWKDHKHYNNQREDYEKVLTKTDLNNSPWHLIEAEDSRHATIKIFQSIIASWENAIVKPANSILNLFPVRSNPIPDMLSLVDTTLHIDRETYKKQLDEYQRELHELEFELYKKRKPVMILFEGCDAAGKGGAIKRVCQSLDPRGYRVTPFAAPTAEELSHHYLWRFWRTIPKNGHIAILDRTWYGRVLVERVEGFCKEQEWRRAYGEINAFENHLVDHGVTVIKFWLQIDQNEQLQRFNERTETPAKQWKITDEDWRNREKWPAYKDAVNEMLAETDSLFASWNLVPANDKLFSRLFILKTIIKQIRKSM